MRRIKGSFQRLLFHLTAHRQWAGHESIPSKKKPSQWCRNICPNEFMHTCTSSDTQTHTFSPKQWRSRGVKSKSGVLSFSLERQTTFQQGSWRCISSSLSSYLQLWLFCRICFFSPVALLPLCSVVYSAFCSSGLNIIVRCICAVSVNFWSLSCFPGRVNSLVCIFVVTGPFHANLCDLILISQCFCVCVCVSSFQTTGCTSETRLLLLPCALPPHPTLFWRSGGRATSQRSLQASFMDLPRLVKPLIRLTIFTTPNPENMPLQTSRAACCRPRSSASWSEEDPLRSSPGPAASRHLSRSPATPRSHRWCTGLSSTLESTRTRPDPRTASSWIHLVAGLHWAAHPLPTQVKTGKFQSYGGSR